MDIDELKKQWQDITIRSERLEEDDKQIVSKVVAGRVENKRKKLASTYLKASLVGLLLPVLAPFFVCILDLPVWEAICYASFGIIMSVANFSMRRHILRTDCIQGPVVEAVKKVIIIRKRIRLIRILGLCLGIPLIFSLGAELISSSEATAYGFIFGLVLGIPIGFMKWHRQSKLSRIMLEDLESGIS